MNVTAAAIGMPGRFIERMHHKMGSRCLWLNPRPGVTDQRRIFRLQHTYRMMTAGTMTSLLWAMAGVVLAGCASQQAALNVQSTQPGKFTTTQVATVSTPEFVICRDTACKQRTTKIIAHPKINAIEAPRSQSQAPIQQETLRTDRYSVFFRVGQHRLDRTGRAEVTSVIEAIKRHKTVKKIVIGGRTDPTGSPKFNQRLALLRASEVKGHLEAVGLDPALISVQAQLPCCDGDLSESADQMQARRRADIEVMVTY